MTSRLVTRFVELRNAIVVIAGATPPAIEVARRAADLGARVRLVVGRDAPSASAADLPGGIAVVEEAPAASHLDGAALLVAAGGPSSAGVLAVAARLGIPAFELGANARIFLDEVAGTRCVQVAATTEGAGAEVERFAAILASIRGKLEDRFPDESDRTAIWDQILDSPVMILLESGQDAEAVEMAERMAWGTG